jgi:alkylation response protein AidB-like acyl-CoA dehydrogenase
MTHPHQLDSRLRGNDEQKVQKGRKMDFTYTETQDMLRDMLARYLADTYDFDKRRAMIHSDAGRDPGVWRALATELGILSAPFSEDMGGMGGGALENAIIMEELGKAIAIEP